MIVFCCLIDINDRRHSYRLLSQDTAQIQYADTDIEEVLHYKYLGITIDQSLSFTLHVQDLVKTEVELGFFL